MLSKLEYFKNKLIKKPKPMNTENENQTENTENVETSQTESVNENALQPGDAVKYTLTPQNKEDHNLHGSPSIAATIKEINGDTAVITIKSFSSKVVDTVLNPDVNYQANAHEAVENDEITINDALVSSMVKL